jgi:hypothetical protein
MFDGEAEVLVDLRGVEGADRDADVVEARLVHHVHSLMQDR